MDPAMNVALQAAQAEASSQQQILAQNSTPLASVLVTFPRGAAPNGDQRSAREKVRSLSNAVTTISEFLDVTAPWTVLHACERNSVPLLLRIISYKPTESNARYQASCATRGSGFVWKAVEDAAALRRTAILEWLTTRYQHMQSHSKLIVLAVKNRHLASLDWIATHLPNNTGGSLEAMDAAITNGDLPVGKWLLKRFPEQTGGHFLQTAIRNGKLEIAKFFVAAGCPFDLVDIMNLAASSRDLGTFKWAHGLSTRDDGERKNTVDPFDLKSLLRAAVNLDGTSGSTENLQWLHDHYPDGWSTDVMNSAAGSGYLDIIK